MLSKLTNILGLGLTSAKIETQAGDTKKTDFSNILAEIDLEVGQHKKNADTNDPPPDNIESDEVDVGLVNDEITAEPDIQGIDIDRSPNSLIDESDDGSTWEPQEKKVHDQKTPAEFGADHKAARQFDGQTFDGPTEAIVRPTQKVDTGEMGLPPKINRPENGREPTQLIERQVEAKERFQQQLPALPAETFVEDDIDHTEDVRANYRLGEGKNNTLAQPIRSKVGPLADFPNGPVGKVRQVGVERTVVEKAETRDVTRRMKKHVEHPVISEKRALTRSSPRSESTDLNGVAPKLEEGKKVALPSLATNHGIADIERPLSQKKFKRVLPEKSQSMPRVPTTNAFKAKNGLPIFDLDRSVLESYKTPIRTEDQLPKIQNYQSFDLEQANAKTIEASLALKSEVSIEQKIKAEPERAINPGEIKKPNSETVQLTTGAEPLKFVQRGLSTEPANELAETQLKSKVSQGELNDHRKFEEYTKVKSAPQKSLEMFIEIEKMDNPLSKHLVVSKPNGKILQQSDQLVSTPDKLHARLESVIEKSMPAPLSPGPSNTSPEKSEPGRNLASPDESKNLHGDKRIHESPKSGSTAIVSGDTRTPPNLTNKTSQTHRPEMTAGHDAATPMTVTQNAKISSNSDLNVHKLTVSERRETLKVFRSTEVTPERAVPRREIHLIRNAEQIAKVEKKSANSQVTAGKPAGLAIAPEMSHRGSVLSVTSPHLADKQDEPLPTELSAGAPLSETRSAPGVVTATPTASRAEIHAVLRQVAEGVARMAEGGVEIRLSPEELGNVRMQMVQGESSMVVHITADRPETLDLMRRHIDQLAKDLAAAGYEGAAFTFGEEGSGGDRGRNPNRRDGSAPRETAQAPPISQTTVSDGLDIRF